MLSLPRCAPGWLLVVTVVVGVPRSLEQELKPY